MGVRPDGLHTQPEAYEHLGEVTTHSLNLKTRYQQMAEARRLFVSAEAADLVVVQDFPAPPPVVWEWLNDPRQRNVWAAGYGVWSAGARPGGRTGVGARNHCAHAHGKGEAVETILDWRPFDYWSFETLDRGTTMLETMQLEPLPDGRTRLHDHIQVRAPLPRFLRRALLNFMMNTMMKYDQMLARSARLLGETLARRPEEAVALPQPGV